MDQPPAFGYMRIERGSSAEESERLRQQIADFVVSQGFLLGDVFVESEDSTSSAFAALIDALNVSGVTTVVVPTMHHLAHMEGVGAAMKERIESETGARIVVICASDGDTP